MRNYSVNDLKDMATDNEFKEHLLDMLSAFDDFCKENGLRYYLSGGTLLGAVRHKGFIPWDDDVDVNMPRPDCEKLMALSGGKIGKYTLQAPNYLQNYHAYHWKLFDESMLVVKKGKNDNIRKVYPAFMDIFPIEGLADTEEENIEHFNEIIEAKYRSNKLWTINTYKGMNPWKRTKINKPISNYENIGREKLFDDVVAIQKRYDFDKSEYIGVMATNVHTVEERVKKEEYMPVEKFEFEGREFPGPKGYDTYLKQLYGGNYMEYPPVYERIAKHGIIPFHANQCDNETLFDWNVWHKKWKEDDKNINVAICGLIKSENIGELFIARSLEYLIGEEFQKAGGNGGIDFREVDLLGRSEVVEVVSQPYLRKLVNYPGYKRRGEQLEKAYLSLKDKANLEEKFFKKDFLNKIRFIIWENAENYRKRLQQYFEERLDGVDFIVVDGAGLLEYSYNEYEFSLYLISKYAEKYNIPIVYNAIGRAGEFDEKDFRCKILKRALQSDSVKYVSARDSQETVQACVGKKQNVKLLADAAFWMKETYDIDTDIERKKIGIGLIRGSALTGYKVDFTEDDWINLFVSIAKELEKRGYEYEFFTNGLPADVEMGRKVLKKLALPTEKMVMRPIDDLELYNTINQYKGIITCRMHSSIAAFTLEIPSVILSWNDKVDKMMDNIGYKERAVSNTDFNAKTIVDQFENALKEGVSQENLNIMKEKSRESVMDYINLIVDTANNK